MPPTLRIDPSVSHQTLEAWEATSHIFGAAKYPALRDEVVRRVAQLGISRLRVEVTDEHDTGTSFNWAGLDTAIRNSTLPLAQALHDARGETLDITACNVSFGSADVANHPHLDPTRFGEFAVAAVERIGVYHGLNVTHFEVCLEPDKVSGRTIFKSPARMAESIIAARKALDAASFGHVKLMAPSCVNTATARDWMKVLRDVYPEAFAALGLLSYHRYRSSTLDVIADIGRIAEASNKPCGQTEYLSGTSGDLHKDLTSGRVSVWHKYGLCGHAENKDARYRDAGHFKISTATATPAILEATATPGLRQYMAYIRPGAVRIGATGEPSPISATAWRNPDGRTVVVVQSVPSVFDVAGLPGGRYEISYATAKGNAVMGSFSVVGKLSVTRPAAASGPLTVRQL